FSNDYDHYYGAYGIPLASPWCSTDGQFTTVGATVDVGDAVPSCFAAGPLKNRWFKFSSPLNTGTIELKTGGAEGDLRTAVITVWEADRTTEVTCVKYTDANAYEDFIIGLTTLTPNADYYITVDNEDPAKEGSFTLCFDKNVDYDWLEGALDIDGFMNGCSANAAYNTNGATPDRLSGSCWANGTPNANRWFKITAPASGVARFILRRGGVYGSQQFGEMALWEADGSTEVACKRYINNGDSYIVMTAPGLTPGNTYYVSVDVGNISYRNTFTLCWYDTYDYDYYEGAIDVTTTFNGCSGNAAYSTYGATGDRNSGSCWANSTPNVNRWFKFTAPANGIARIILRRGGVYGNQQFGEMALWEADGTTEVNCRRYINNGDSYIVMSTLGLTPGATYYLSVDVSNTSYQNSFTLCFYDTLDYDYYEGAIDITGILGGCSGNAAYSTYGATSDRLSGSCWVNGTPNVNRWFKFTADASGIARIILRRGGVYGNQQFGEMALWEADGTTEVNCRRYINNGDSYIVMTTLGLTPGATYYLSVDVSNTSYQNSFTLCYYNTVDYDFYEGAIDVTGTFNGCSGNAAYSTYGATSDRLSGSCWVNGTPNVNRWFKFTAPASGVARIILRRGGVYGNQQFGEMALWENDGMTEVNCRRYINNGDSYIVMTTPGLTPGDTYYLSVDVSNTSYQNSFTLCFYDTYDYDYYEGAIDVTGTFNGCSGNAAYSTYGATSDRLSGSCWVNGTPNVNRWFKFTSITEQVQIQIRRGGSYGNQQFAESALWESDGTTELACKRYVNSGDWITYSYLNLTPGNVYYISVDVSNTNYQNSFTLCLDDLDPYAVCQNVAGGLDGTGNITIAGSAMDGGSQDASLPLIFTPSQGDFDCSDIALSPITVTLTVTDQDGNSSTCNSDITIADLLPPAMVCQDISVNLDASGNATITPAMIDNGSADNCTATTLSLDITDFTCVDAGPNTVTLTGVDGYGNSASCTATVTVLDDIPDNTLAVSDPIICFGDNADIDITASEVGVTYQLRLDSDDSNVGAAIAGNGAVITFTVSPAATTVYNVLATSDATSCSIELIDKSTVTVNNLPDNSLTVTDPNICDGDNASIDVSVTELGVSYQLRLNSDDSNVGAPIAGNNGLISFTVSPAVTTIYNVLATTGATSCSVELTDLSTVTVTPIP
ncbi:MAG: hypothetical protein DRI54_06370, partial [Bacteroidetes bacterium]